MHGLRQQAAGHRDSVRPADSQATAWFSCVIPSGTVVGFMTPNYSSQDDYSPEERFEAAQDELEAARWLSDFSLTAYLKGNLQRAGDARSRAAILCARAAEILTTPEFDKEALNSIRSLLNRVRDALPQPLPVDFKLRRATN